MRIRYGLVAAISVVVCLGGCTGKHSTTRSQPAVESYSAWGLTFDYPGAWRAVTFRYPGKASDAMPFVWLSNQSLHQPCHRTSDGYGCGLPLRNLELDGVLVSLRAVAVPASIAPFFPVGMTVGRDKLPGTQTVTRPGWCHRVGGDVTIETTFFDASSRTTYLTDACLRGPELKTTEARIQAMLASVRVT